MIPNPAPVKTTLGEERLRSLIIKRIRAAFVPSSVYRVQLNRNFTFKHAKALIPYLKELGVEAIYCSPYFQAAPGSMHGYNVTDPNRINPEIGSPEEYAQFCNALTQNGLGHIVDVVPNHMGISADNNRWWHDVLENGPSSLYARYFDIDWHPVKQELWGKVLLPILGNFYGRVLEKQEISLAFRKGEFSITYTTHCLPIDPKTYPLILADKDGELEKKTGQGDHDYLEYMSVVTAFNNLPDASVCAPDKMLERNREKEIAKHRLEAVAERSAGIREYIASRVSFFNGTKTDPRSFDPLDELLNRQPYRLAFWSVASQEINYRRFFDINELAAIRIEDEKVFRHYHELLFQLIKEGRITGLRIDHPDGLYDPPTYFHRLQRECLLQMAVKEWEERARPAGGIPEELDTDATREALDHLLREEFATTQAFYVVVEKILDRKEPLPGNWNISGTVGYDFLNALNGLYVDPRNQEAFGKLYTEYIGHAIDFDDLVYNKKKFFGLVPMASEINALGHRLDRISESDRNFRDFTRNDLTVAIREVIAGFPVYRTYVSPDSTAVSERDERYIRVAVKKARARTPALNPAVYDFLRDVLLLKLKTDIRSVESDSFRDFLLRFQQLTGPIMAKGVEDTSFYVYNRLISLNEVGGDPFYFGHTPEDFHRQNIDRNKRWPHSMIASSTHDTKRSEDVRMRINALSESPALWRSKISEWAKLNERYKTLTNGVREPRRNTEYFIYQTLIGVWPDGPYAAAGRAAFFDRIWQCVLKSIREAKIYTSWSKPDSAYEDAVKRFTRAILSGEASRAFLKSFLPFQRRIAALAKLSGVSANVLKIASPGVVDIYQGNETWDYSLVDPDNRRAVDFAALIRRLRDIRKVFSSGRENALSRIPPDDLKLLYTWKTLGFRRQHKDLFVGGEYIPVEVRGKRSRHIVAFIRKRGNKIALAAGGRFFSPLPLGDDPAASSGAWETTELIWPASVEAPASLRDIITSDIIPIIRNKRGIVIRAADLFRHSTAALATNVESLP